MIQITKRDLLPFIRSYLPDNPVIVEAGSFDGHDTLAMSRFWPHGTIHAFEPVPEIFMQLATNTTACSNVRCYPYALSNTTGTASLYVSAKPEAPDQPCQAGSLLKPKERLTWSNIVYPKTITVHTITLDDWATHNAVDHIDFLWLDVQGFALQILQAAPQMLATLKALYVEVEFIEAYEQQHQYHDVRQWLEDQGLEMIARDFTDAPTWFFGNALFVRKN